MTGRWRRLRVGLAGLLVAGLVAGCSTIPTTGQVESTPRSVPSEGLGGITILPQPPAQGARQDMIVTGFLTAMTSRGADYATARAYLTGPAARQWHPEAADLLIYPTGTMPAVEGDTVHLSANLVGGLRPDGSFYTLDDPAWDHDFGLVREQGQWRISNPPDGLVVSQQLFSQIFARVNAYFFPLGSSTLVPDRRYIQSGAGEWTRAAELVLGGPSSWLEVIVDNLVRRTVTLAGEVTLSTTGVADVPLSASAGQLSARQATRLAVEVAATMRAVAGVTAVRLLDGATPLRLIGAGADGALPLAAVDQYDTTRPASSALVTVQDSVLVSSAVPVAGDWGQTERAIVSFALHSDQVAAVTAEGLLVGRTGAGPPELVVERPGLLRPQYDVGGNLWVVDSGPAGAITVLTGTAEVVLDTAELGEMAITGFAVSPDGRRILLVRASTVLDETRSELGVGLISYQDGVPQAIISYRPIRVTWDGAQLTTIVDAAWSGPSTVLVLGGLGVTPAGLYRSDIDGLDIEGLGRGWNTEPVEMAVLPTLSAVRVIVLDADQAMWSLLDPYRWVGIAGSATAIAFPS